MLQDLELEQIEEFLTRWHELAFGAGEEAQLLHYPPNPPYQGGNQSWKLASPLPEQGGNQNLKLASPLTKGGLLAKRHEVRGVNNDSSARSEEGKKKQERLQQAIEESPAIRQLAGNPLLLTMMAILNRNQELPRNRAELYSQASKVLLQQWDVERALIQKDAITIDFKDKQAMLRRVAYQMQGNDKGLAGNLINAEDLEGILRDYLERNLEISDAGANAKSIVKQLRERNFILCFLGADYYAFVHRTFLEYFCAREFVWRYEKERSLSLEELKIEVFGRHWQDKSWHEVLRLIVGMIDTKFAGEMIEYLIEQDGKDGDISLLLAAQCLSEVRNRSAISATATRLLSHLKNLTKSKKHYGDGSAVACVTCGSLDGWTPFMGGFYTQAVSEIATTWKDEPGTLVWLKTCAQSEEDRNLRGVALEELAKGWKNDHETSLFLKTLVQSDVDPTIRGIALQELVRVWKDNPNTVSILKACAFEDESGFVQKTAIRELAKGWKDEPGMFEFLCERAINDPFEMGFLEGGTPRKVALEVIVEYYPNYPQILLLLRERAVNDPDEEMRQVAVQSLTKGWKDEPRMLEFLQECAVNDRNGGVRRVAVQALAQGWKDEPEMFEFLCDRAANDEADYTRKTALEAIIQQYPKYPRTLSLLCDRAVNDPNGELREFLVATLARGWKNSPEKFEFLCDRATNDPYERPFTEDTNPRHVALEAIIYQYPDHPQTLPLLRARAKNDPDGVVRYLAVQALLQRWKDEPWIFDFLYDRALNDPFEREEYWQNNPRQTALKAIIRQYPNHPQTLPLLQDRAKNDPDEKLREFAKKKLKNWS